MSERTDAPGCARGGRFLEVAGIALATLAATTGIKLLFPHELGYGTPFLLYFAPVLATSLHSGAVAGGLTTVASASLAVALFMREGWDVSLGSPRFAGAVAGFLIEGAALVAVGSYLRRARQSAARAFDEARDAAAKLAVVLDNVDEGITMQDESGHLLYANEPAARVVGYASPAELLAAPPAEIAERYALFDEGGAPFPFDELPGRVALREGRPAERLIRFRERATGVERWSQVRASAVPAGDGGRRLAVNLFRDVTDRRRAEEAERISREWFETALRSIGDAVIATDAAGVVTFMNPVAEELTGWPLADAAGRPLAEVFPICNETTREPAPSPVELVLREGRAVGLANHTVLRRRDGSERAIDDSAAPIRRADGELVGAVLVFRDVSSERTERDQQAFLARAGAELGASLDIEDTLSSLTRLAVPRFADWVAVDLVEGGGGLRRLAVVHADPVRQELARRLEERYPPDPDAPRGAFRVARTGQPELVPAIPRELVVAAARDEEHLALIEALELHSYIAVPLVARGRILGVLSFAMAESRRRYDEEDLAFAAELARRAGVAVDNARLFRELERASAAIEAERRRLHDLIREAPVAIAPLFGPDHVVELPNQPFRALLGGDDPSGRPAREVGAPPAVLSLLDQVYRTGTTIRRPELAIPAAGGDLRFLDVTVQAARDASGAIEGVVAFALDVSDQVEARRRVEAARAEAERASRSKDEFLAMLGHELRNPLAPILTALQLMELRAQGALVKERTVIERQVQHVVRLVDDLLDVSRITGGKVELRRELLDVGEVVAQAVELASSLIEERRHRLSIQVEPDLLVEGDPTRLAQVLTNIITNAAKYTEPDGRIDITARADGESVVFAVRDSGMGIAADMLPRIFDLFSQEPQALDRARGGLGLGLAIARSLVLLHGGEVSAASDGPGTGSEFRVRLPRARRAPASAGGAAPPARAAGLAARERILVVDDNADAADLLADALELLGHQVWRAADGAEALEVAAACRPTVALLDIGLPGMDGYQLARRLRELDGLGGVKLIAVTGYGQAADRERSHAAGFDAHLVKPISLDQVQSAISALRGRPPGAR